MEAFLRSVRVSHGMSLGCGQHDPPDIAVVAAISGACGEGCCPHLLVGETMGTDDGCARELMAQLLDNIDSGKFEVHYRHVRAVPWDRMTQIVDSPNQVYSPKMVVQGLGQRFTRIAVALGDNYTERFHTAHPWVGWRRFRRVRILQDTLQELGAFISWPMPVPSRAHTALSEVFRSA
jgi:hypothetical protein